MKTKKYKGFRSIHFTKLFLLFLTLSSCEKEHHSPVLQQTEEKVNLKNEEGEFSIYTPPLFDPTNIPATVAAIAEWADGLAIEITCVSCDNWRVEQTSAWHEKLPDCPCELSANDRPEGFEKPTPVDKEDPYHPGAAFCIRSSAQPGQPGQQCCYDEEGKLITGGEGAGTPDIVAPVIVPGGEYAIGEVPNPIGPGDIDISIPLPPNYEHVIAHFRKDVIPYFLCKRSGDLACYLKERPPNNGYGCDENIPQGTDLGNCEPCHAVD